MPRPAATKGVRRPATGIAALLRRAVVMLLALVGTAAAATFIVDDSLDDVDLVPGDGVCLDASGSCTLRAAIQEANALPGPDSIELAVTFAYVYLAGAGEDASATGDLDITDDLTITAPTSDIPGLRAFVHFTGTTPDRTFDVRSGTVTIENLQVAACNGTCANDGGVVAVAGAATLTLRNVLLDGVSILFDGHLNSSRGGAVYNEGTLTLETSVVLYSNALEGGGIFNLGTLVVRNSSVAANRSSGLGGGGLANYGTATLLNSQVGGNEATVGNGGGIRNVASSSPGSLTLRNVTISSNQAIDGGGIANDAVDMTPVVTLSNTIIADNMDVSGPATPDCEGTLTSSGYNLIESTLGCTITGDTSGNIIGSDPMLVMSTLSFPRLLWPGSGSPAIDAGNPATPGSGGDACEATDQDGIPRTPWGDPRCDIGSVEVKPCAGRHPYCLQSPPGMGSLAISDSVVDEKDLVKWKTGKTPFVVPNPVTDAAEHRLCVYQGNELVLGMSIPPGGICAGKPCWKSTPTSFTYVDKDLTPDGAKKVRLKTYSDGQTRLLAQGKGSNLKLLSPPWAGTVRAQYVVYRPLDASFLPQCREDVFPTPLVNTPTQFRAKSD